nr:DUF3782 domain-containing protein [Caldilineaceae bacterium]
MQPTLTLEEVEEMILARLPGILEQDPNFVTFVEGIVAEKFPRRDEFARLLDEVREHRVETAQQSQRVEQRVERVEDRVERVEQRVERVDQQLQEHRAETTAQFQRVDQRFEQVDQRFEQVDQRFEQVDLRFEQVDQRFEQVDQRFVDLTQRMEDGFRNVQISIDRLGQRWGIRNESIFRQTMREVLEKSFDTRVEERLIAGEQFDCVIIGTAHILIEISASVGKDILKKMERKRQLYMDETGVVPARFLLAVGSIHSQRANALRN